MTEFVLHRFEDPSNVSGTGTVARGVEWEDGAVAVRWPGDHPSTAVWSDIRDVEAIHGHGGKTVVTYLDPYRLVSAYKRVCFFLSHQMIPERLPLSVDTHPDWPDRLLVEVHPSAFGFWVVLLDGSENAATHEEVKGELVTTWVSPDGNLWVQCSQRGTFEDLLEGQTYDEDPLAIFDREDR